MRKIIIQRILLMAIICQVVVVGILFVVLSNQAEDTADSTASVLLDQIAAKMTENELEVAELKESLDTEYIVKARAFARMIELNPAIINDFDKLCVIQEELEVDELHVTDEDAVLYWGTIPGYYGFDFKTSDQAKVFVPIISDPSIEIAQEPTPNGAEGKLFQYVGVARKDAAGVVQIGMTPERLDKALENNSIGNVLDDYTIGITGYVFALNKSDATVAAHPTAALVGTDGNELGINVGTGMSGFATIDGSEMYYNSREIGDYLVYTAYPKAEMYANRWEPLITSCLLVMVVLAVLIVVVILTIRSVMGKGIEAVMDAVDKIAGGDMDARLDVRTCPEFVRISDGINLMVEKIDSKIKETHSLIDEQRELLGKINSSSGVISKYSEHMEGISKSIADGATRQAESVTELNEMFNAVLGQVHDNTSAAKNASAIADDSEKKLEYGMEKLSQMNNSMAEINEASKSIGQVIKTVSDIAFQTNILALNASVEAARAGVHGKGFAVVATEVRNLANKTADAAGNTTELIESALRTIENGQMIAKETSVAMDELLEGTKKSAALINEISVATANQGEAIESMTVGVNQIANVIQDYVRMSSEAEDTADKLFRQADQLNRLVTMK